MDGKQLCGIHDISSRATLYYFIVGYCKLEKEFTTDALFIILRQVRTVTKHNKKIIDTGRLYKNTVTEK